MEKQEAINLMKLWRASVEMNGADSEHLDAFDMAIEALSEPSRQGQRDGLISRQDVYDLIDNWGEPMMSRRVFRCDIEDLPSAQPERKKGKWIYDGDCYICNQCKSAFNWWADSQTSNYCPNCGADMRGESDGQRNDADA